jgi:hypothetical protein
MLEIMVYGSDLSIEDGDLSLTISDEMILLKKDTMYGYLDINGNEIISHDYEWASPFKNGYAIVEIDGSYGYINKKGAIIIEAQYEFAQPVSENGIGVVYDSDRNISIIEIN